MASKRATGNRSIDTDGGNTLALNELKPDQQNRRQRTDRGAAMLVDALQDVGAARSIVIDEQNDVLAGNGVVEAAAKVGIDKVRVIETDGDEIIAVRRRNLTPDQKRRLAIYDNRTSELAEWDLEQLRADDAAGLDLEAFFERDELDDMLDAGDGGRQAHVEEVDTTPVADTFWISIRGPLPQQAYALRQLRALLGELAGVTVELGTVAAEAEE